MLVSPKPMVCTGKPLGIQTSLVGNLIRCTVSNKLTLYNCKLKSKRLCTRIYYTSGGSY